MVLFSKIKIKHVLDQLYKVRYTLSLFYAQVEDYQNILNGDNHLILLHKNFLKKKRTSRTSLSGLFSARFLNENISNKIFY